MNEKSLRVLEYFKIKDKIKKYTSTSASKRLIDDLRPYGSVYEVKEHIEETKEAFELLMKKGTPPFEGAYDVTEAVGMAEKGFSLMPGQLLKVANMLKCARNFKEYIAHKDEEESYRIIEDICSGIIPLRNVENSIFNAIIGEDEISDKASTALYGIRRSLKDKNASIKDRVNSMMRNYSKYLQENLYTIRGDRYVIPVKAEYKAQVPGLVHDQSSTGATLFIEPMGLVNLNNEIKELMLKEKAEIERILRELSMLIYKSIIAVKNDEKIVTELDFIFAKAKYASSINATAPHVNDNGIIDIVMGRHPLIDTSKVVPLDIYMGREFTSLIITGPNTGGKTVTLKTTGLIELMAMSGLMIPARENSTISFFNEVYADIGDEQSIEQSLSTFSSHMTNIVKIIDNADKNSLVLFDELGAGTDPTEGAALAVSILENLRKRGTKIVATTHYSELKAYALKTENVENASVEFDVETLRPTYRLLIGIPGKSNAFEISKRLGLSDYIIEDARRGISKDTLDFEDLIQNLQTRSVKAEENLRRTEFLKEEAENLKEKYEKKASSITETREKALHEGRREAKRIIEEAKMEADKILKDMREMERMGYSSDARQKLQESRQKLKEKLDKAEENLNKDVKHEGEMLKEVKEGEEVFIPSLNMKGIVVSTVDNKGEVEIQAGIMKINVKLKELRKSDSSIISSKKNKANKKREAKLNLRSVSQSIDLRGMDSEEAMYKTDIYLDEAYMAGLNSVTVIHGKGTGVLRKAINDMLKRNSHVKSYRLGNFGEGGTGVTVVELK
ncbi:MULTISPECIES: endonuclease MutS2 [Clostridium]|uniref:endonuclease MutS2 n=1 Tax=Clostridium TaxID=1485 RepID=UPI000825A790|nr:MULTISPECIES: endonuclease MutS2 [Clostridium]PJI09701.1 endonuclease MutS2 [Clostridium sp. CT7]